MKTWNQRLAEELAKRNIKGVEVARATGVKPPSVTEWLNGTTQDLKADNAEKLCAFLGINQKWLLTGKGPQYIGLKEPAGVYDADYPVSVAFKKVSLRATLDGVSGFEIQFDDDETVKPIYYRRDWIEKNGYKPDLLGVRSVSGSSMEPALFDGDTVLIYRGHTTPRNGFVYAVMVDGHPCIKRLKKRGADWWVTSDNPAHSHSDVQLENENQIIGQAVERRTSNI
jgi:phage repressor protein C with HTH and peptisase S24 domain